MNSRKNYSKIEIEIANISDIINNQQKGITPTEKKNETRLL